MDSRINRNRKCLNIPIGTPVEISFVPAPVTNIKLYATGVTASHVKQIGMIKRVDVQLDDGRLIGWNLDYLNII
ncbi:MAG: hypothetical protein AAGF26_18040 [Cyanobacteria bacterium P01_G01_bin.49]